MSIFLNLCGLLVSVNGLPDETLKTFYADYYHCRVIAEQAPAKGIIPQLTPTHKIAMYFPSEKVWWPVFTLDQVGSNSFNRFIQHGIKPGILLPDENFDWIQYKNAKVAVAQGAIPIIEYHPEQQNYFSAKAVLSTAFGLRPLAAFVPTGWDPSLLAQPKGSYIVQQSDPNQIPLPAREIIYKQHYFYNAVQNSAQDAGNQVLINPPEDIPLENIEYPKFGISWNFHGVDYTSTETHIETNIIGYFFIFTSFLIIPLDLLLNSQYPGILTTVGSSVSWVSLIIGIALLSLLIISILRKVRAHGPD